MRLKKFLRQPRDQIPEPTPPVLPLSKTSIPYNVEDLEDLDDDDDELYSPRKYPKPSRIARLVMEDTWAIPSMAAVTAYFASKDAWWFVVRAQMEDGSSWELSRQYQDFYNLHLSLEQYLTTAKDTEGTRGIELPFMPMPERVIDGRITHERRPYLNNYMQKTLRFGYPFTSHYLIRGFFVPRGNDRRCKFPGEKGDRLGKIKEPDRPDTNGPRVAENTTAASGLVWFVECSTLLRVLDREEFDREAKPWDIRNLSICELQRLSTDFCQVYLQRKESDLYYDHDDTTGCDLAMHILKEAIHSDEGIDQSSLAGVCSPHFGALGGSIYRELVRRYPHLKGFSNFRRNAQQQQQSQSSGARHFRGKPSVSASPALQQGPEHRVSVKVTPEVLMARAEEEETTPEETIGAVEFPRPPVKRAASNDIPAQDMNLLSPTRMSGKDSYGRTNRASYLKNKSSDFSLLDLYVSYDGRSSTIEMKI